MTRGSTDRHLPRPADESGLAVADLGRRPSADPETAVHELRVFDPSGHEWRGLVGFSDPHDGRETPARIGDALLDLVGGADSPLAALASMQQPIRLFERGPTLGRVGAGGTSGAASRGDLREPADGRDPERHFPRPVEDVLDTYHLPRRTPVVVWIVVWCVAIGFPVPLLWWLVLPHTVAITVGLGLLELAIVFGGLLRVFASAELTRLPRRRPVQAPSTKGPDGGPRF